MGIVTVKVTVNVPVTVPAIEGRGKRPARRPRRSALGDDRGPAGQQPTPSRCHTVSPFADWVSELPAPRRRSPVMGGSPVSGGDQSLGANAWAVGDP